MAHNPSCPVGGQVDDRVDVLTDINLDDLIESAGLSRLPGPPLRALCRHLLRPIARRFALTAHEFDTRVGQP